MNGNSPLDTTVAAESELADIELGPTSILVAGYLAAVYASGASGCPVPHWGHEWANRGIRIENDFWTASRATRVTDGKHVAGVNLVITKNYYGGERSFEKFFIPFESLTKMSVFVAAVKL